jgi:VWFA-related protein
MKSFISVTNILVIISVLSMTANGQANCAAQQVRTVNFSAIDKSGQTVQGLRAEDLSLKIENKAITISDFSAHVDEPFDVALLIDISLSEEQALPQIKVAAKAFLDAVRSGSENRIALVAFSNEVKAEEPLTKDAQNIYLALQQLKVDIPPGYVGGGMVISRSPTVSKSKPGGSTSLWDVTRKAMGEVFDRGTSDRQRAVLLFTDGQDTSSSGKLKTAIEESLKQNVVVYVVGTTNSYVEVARDPLTKLAQETGGVALFAKKPKDYGTALTEIFRRMSTQYRIRYCGDAAPSEKLEIKVINPEIKKLSPELAYRRN